jgi:acetyl esterase/lipase
VAVIGTGASAIQFVPAIAGRAARLTVFQRSPAYVIPRPDRAYARWERAMFRRMPWTTRLYRAGIYLKYESRALAFTRFRGLMKVAVGLPFRSLLARQVPDPALRQRLIPDYPIGCKRILLSSDYLAAISRPNVELETQAIRRITADGIETVDGVRHQADVIVYGTGFAATEFLAPMRISGPGGVNLNDAWRAGAQAYLGVTVPGFPNFFMIYGPNTNLGHNSIVYMIESQVAHVMRCLEAMKKAGAETIEVDSQLHRRFNRRIQQRLAHTVWNGCKSWYLDAMGHNSTNWPGFTLSYRWLTKYGGLQAYTLIRRSTTQDGTVAIAAPAGLLERLNAGMVRMLLRACFRPFVGPPWGAGLQRFVVGLLSPLMPGVPQAVRSSACAGAVPVEVVTPRAGEGSGAILYLHGGAFCLGNPGTHRSITTRLAAESGMTLWVPDYRLAPEHPYPAALDDALACYEAMLAGGRGAGQVVLAGDSAGGALALALALRLKERGAAMPAGLLLISPVADPGLTGSTLASKRGKDPMVRQGWLEHALRWYACPATVSAHRPLETDLSGLPPMLVHAGEDEILLADSTRLARRAVECGVPCRLEVYEKRWHVFHLSSFYLRSARVAVRRLAAFASESINTKPVPVKLAKGGQQ